MTNDSEFITIISLVLSCRNASEKSLCVISATDNENIAESTLAVADASPLPRLRIVLGMPSLVAIALT
eukprot:jgi/Psemu1/59438/gm1.59438_g